MGVIEDEGVTTPVGGDGGGTGVELVVVGIMELLGVKDNEEEEGVGIPLVGDSKTGTGLLPVVGVSDGEDGT